MTNGPPPQPAGPGRSVVWILIAVAGFCAVCGAGTVALFGLGVVAGASEAVTEPGASGSPGAPGGFAFTVPEGFAVVSEGRWRFEKLEGDARHTADLIRLPAIAGADDPFGKLERAWNETIVRDWPGAPTKVLPLRRFVNNGARAYFTSAQLKAAGNQHASLVSLYLVEADDRFEPFVVVQEYFDDSVGAVMVAKGSFDVTHAAVEAVLKGVDGSPVGRPLVDDAEVVGRWTCSSGAQAQYVNVLTGGTTFSGVSYTVKYAFEADHGFSYDYAGATTTYGSTEFGGEKDTGRWRVEHDLLIVEGEKRTRRFFIVGAGPGPTGKRVLHLMPEGNWSLSPGAIGFHGELYEG